MGDNRLVGQNYRTPDLVAKVTGQAKYSEDFRVDGMLYVKLLLSPVPHGRVRSIDTSAAEAMPGVRAILRASDMPAPADVVTDLGETIEANLKGEQALTDEPLYAGEPVLAVAAVDEETAAAAIEAIDIDFEPLPFVVDPLVTLRPDGPNARLEGNCWGRPADNPQAPIDVQEIKWASADFGEVREGRLPEGDAQEEWQFGDLDAGFREASLVLDETFSTANNQHHVLEPRSALAYWQNGKLFVHAGTQSAVQTVASLARWMQMDMEDVVLITEYTGGGFGSRATGAVIYTIPAVLSRMTGSPVMMRISREEEQYIGGIRPAIHGRVRAGFASDGRLLALDMTCVGENSAYEPQGDAGFAGTIVSLLYQPRAMRMRGTTVLTNTPPRRAQSQPGGMQGITIMEPVMSKAARQLGIDQVAIRRVNAPVGKAPFGPAFGDFRPTCTSSFLVEALDRGVELFDWPTRLARSGQRSGSKVRGAGVSVSTFVAGSTGFDGLFVIRPDGRMYIQSGVGNLGTESFSDVHRVAAEMMGIPWDKVEIAWGDTSQNLPWTCVSGGSQTTHAMTRAAHAAASDAIAKAQQIAASVLGGNPADYRCANERISDRSGRSMTLAQVAQRAVQMGGRYDGHELPEDINEFTVRSAEALAGEGLMGVARDNYERDGTTFAFVAGFAEVEVDVETGDYRILDYLAVGDSGTIIHPKSYGGQILGRSVLGMGHALAQKTVYDQHYGLPLATRMYQSRPPTILDVPRNMQWDAVDLPDPETPVGAKGIGEPPVAAGAAAVLNALSAAIGDDLFQRSPVTLDTILMALEHGQAMQEPLTAHI